MSDHRDTLSTHKDAVVNFVKWLREHQNREAPGQWSDTEVEANVEKFLATQHSGPRHVAHCTHCGGDQVVAADFKDRPARQGEIKDPEEKGPAWQCTCGAWTARHGG